MPLDFPSSALVHRPLNNTTHGEAEMAKIVELPNGEIYFDTETTNGCAIRIQFPSAKTFEVLVEKGFPRYCNAVFAVNPDVSIDAFQLIAMWKYSCHKSYREWFSKDYSSTQREQLLEKALAATHHIASALQFRDEKNQLAVDGLKKHFEDAKDQFSIPDAFPNEAMAALDHTKRPVSEPNRHASDSDDSVTIPQYSKYQNWKYDFSRDADACDLEVKDADTYLHEVDSDDGESDPEPEPTHTQGLCLSGYARTHYKDPSPDPENEDAPMTAADEAALIAQRLLFNTHSGYRALTEDRKKEIHDQACKERAQEKALQRARQARYLDFKARNLHAKRAAELEAIVEMRKQQRTARDNEIKYSAPLAIRAFSCKRHGVNELPYGPHREAKRAKFDDGGDDE